MCGTQRNLAALGCVSALAAHTTGGTGNEDTKQIDTSVSSLTRGQNGGIERNLHPTESWSCGCLNASQVRGTASRCGLPNYLCNSVRSFVPWQDVPAPFPKGLSAFTRTCAAVSAFLLRLTDRPLFPLPPLVSGTSLTARTQLLPAMRLRRCRSELPALPWLRYAMVSVRVEIAVLST